MKKILTLIILILNINCFSQIQDKTNKEGSAEFHKVDKVLNEVYQKILTEYKTNTTFIENLKKSQRIWIKFRDAELDMKYPKYLDKSYKNVQPNCRAFYLKDLTEKRISTLKQWVSGTEKGCCNGTVKIIESIDPEDMGKAYIKKDSSISKAADMKYDYRIFGYKEKNIHSEKMILLSIFTDEVENNPFECKYGAFYSMYGVKNMNMNLKYLATKGDFLRIAIIKEGKIIDKVYMLKKWFEFEKE